MSDTWVIDLQHYLTPAGAMADMPSPARRLAEYLASIVMDAATHIDEPPSVRCRRRPQRRPCSGIVVSYPTLDEHDSIHWYCPACFDNGVITGWQGTLWHGFAEPGAAS